MTPAVNMFNGFVVSMDMGMVCNSNQTRILVGEGRKSRLVGRSLKNGKPQTIKEPSLMKRLRFLAIFSAIPVSVSPCPPPSHPPSPRRSSPPKPREFPNQVVTEKIPFDSATVRNFPQCCLRRDRHSVRRKPRFFLTRHG